MNFHNENHNDFTVVRPEFDRLDSIAAPEFREFITELAQDKKTPLVVDLINVEFMDSSGLGAVIGCYKATQSTGGLSFCNMSGDVKEVFVLTHMDKIFYIHDDLDACLTKLTA